MFEYKVVPAPKRGMKSKGLKGSEDRFAFALETVMNELAAEGWEYLRTDTLPAEERDGLMSKTTVFQNMLVFRRARLVDQPRASAPPVAAPEPEAPKAPENTDQVDTEAEEPKGPPTFLRAPERPSD